MTATFPALNEYNAMGCKALPVGIGINFGGYWEFDHAQDTWRIERHSRDTVGSGAEGWAWRHCGIRSFIDSLQIAMGRPPTLLFECSPSMNIVAKQF